MAKFLVLLKKEIKELITLQMILPMVVVIIMFSLIGNIISKETAKFAAPQQILILNQDTVRVGDKISEILKASNFKTEVLIGIDIAEVLDRARENRISSVLVITSNFENDINNFRPHSITIHKIAENFSISSDVKYSGLDRAVNIISTYYSNDWISKKKTGIDPEILKNPVKVNEFVVIGDKTANISLSAVSGYIRKQTTFIPIILFLVIILASQMVAMAVAGEKENKTFEILLSSPVSRKTIVFAKLIAAGLVALLLAGVYMIGMNSYINRISGGTVSMGDGLMSIFSSLGIIITPLGYLLLGASLFMGILVGLAIAMILGVLSENIKSVQATITPLMIMVLLPYFLVLLLDINTISPILKYIIYIIPFSHPFLASQNIILGNYLPIVYGIIYQFIVFMVFVVIATKIFSSDKIITLKLNFGKKKKI
ncbi:MAG TPA: ABC transporter permease [Candidatus Paceibacterota bacterium]|nr:ABC transporter permease [Candidatus Paceibacterota bacterium]